MAGLSILCSVLNPEGANAPCQLSLPFPDGERNHSPFYSCVVTGPPCRSLWNGRSTFHACQQSVHRSRLLNLERRVHTTLRSSQFLNGNFNAAWYTVYGVQRHVHLFCKGPKLDDDERERERSHCAMSANLPVWCYLSTWVSLEYTTLFVLTLAFSLGWSIIFSFEAFAMQYIVKLWLETCTAISKPTHCKNCPCKVIANANPTRYWQHVNWKGNLADI